MVYHLLKCNIWTCKKMALKAKICQFDRHKISTLFFLSTVSFHPRRQMSFSIQIFVISLICQTCGVYLSFQGSSQGYICYFIRTNFKTDIPLFWNWHTRDWPLKWWIGTLRDWHVTRNWIENVRFYGEGGNWQFTKEKGVKKRVCKLTRSAKLGVYSSM